MRILNLTQHTATPQQIAAGVFEPQEKERVRELLTFNTLPSYDEVLARAEALAEIAAKECEAGNDGAMIGGAPYLMAPLEIALKDIWVKPVYSFSARVTKEKTLPDGRVEKTQVFEHLGFIEVP